MHIRQDTKVQSLQDLSHSQHVILAISTLIPVLDLCLHLKDVIQVAINGVPNVIECRRTSPLNRVTQFCFHQLVVTNTNLLLGQRRQIKRVVSGYGTKTCAHDRVSQLQISRYAFRSRVLIVLVDAIECILATSGET